MCEESHLPFVCKRKSKVQVLHQLSVSLEVKNFDKKNPQLVYRQRSLVILS